MRRHYIGRMGNVLIELRMAARRLRGDRWAAGGAILAAALGAGLNTAVFAVAYGVLLRPLPYADAQRLAIVDVDASVTRVAEWGNRLTSFEQFGAYVRESLTAAIAGVPGLAAVAVIDDGFFPPLGARPRAGRTWSRGDSSSVVVSERLARQQGTAIEGVLGSQ